MYTDGNGIKIERIAILQNTQFITTTENGITYYQIGDVPKDVYDVVVRGNSIVDEFLLHYLVNNGLYSKAAWDRYIRAKRYISL